MAKTISLSLIPTPKVTVGLIKHNNRTGSITPNIDLSRTKDNKILIEQDLEEAYAEAFGEAVKAYNSRQKRKDRQIENYMEHIEKSGNGEKLFQDIVVQFGDKDNTGLDSGDWDVIEKALTHYVNEFQERNPNLHVFNAVLHFDEKTPHGHISFLPLAENYKKGLSKRNSFSKSMNDRFETKEGVGAWFKYEREILTGIAEQHGIEIEVLGEERKHLALKDYKLAKDKIKHLQEDHAEIMRESEAEWRGVREETKKKIIDDLQKFADDSVKELKHITEAIKPKKIELEKLETLITKRRLEVIQFKAHADVTENKYAVQLKERLEQHTDNYQQDVEKLHADLGQLEDHVLLQKENKLLKAELAEKDSIIKEQKKVINRLERTIIAVFTFIEAFAVNLIKKFDEFFERKSESEDIYALSIMKYKDANSKTTEQAAELTKVNEKQPPKLTTEERIAHDRALAEERRRKREEETKIEIAKLKALYEPKGRENQRMQQKHDEIMGVQPYETKKDRKFNEEVPSKPATKQIFTNKPTTIQKTELKSSSNLNPDISHIPTPIIQQPEPTKSPPETTVKEKSSLVGSVITQTVQPTPVAQEFLDSLNSDDINLDDYQIDY